ncbi:MAG: FAD binding domain-containing protein [Treponema sp.]|nr:FAD binding domain-containing protein [Treponema sp.]
MDAPLNQVLFPATFADYFAAWNRFPDAVPFAGGTSLTAKREEALESAPIFLCLDKIEELHRVTRTEHYLEIGAMVKLNKLTALGKIVPEVLCSCLKNIAGFQLRNIASIGGNICCISLLHDLPAPLIALDAQYELRTSQTARWISAGRFHMDVPSVLGKQELLTRIRLPLHKWDYSVYRKFYCENFQISESLVFLAKTQKSILSEIRVIYKGSSILRNKNAEDILNGKYLPLNHKTAGEFILNWSEFLAHKQNISEFSRNSIINSIEENVFNLSE